MKVASESPQRIRVTLDPVEARELVRTIEREGENGRMVQLANLLSVVLSGPVEAGS